MPGEGWEMLRMQIYSMIDVPSEQLKLFGLGLDKGRHNQESTDSLLAVVSPKHPKTMLTGPVAQSLSFPGCNLKPQDFFLDCAASCGALLGRACF